MRLGVILRDAPPGVIHHPKVVLRGCVSLLRGLAIPRRLPKARRRRGTSRVWRATVRWRRTRSPQGFVSMAVTARGMIAPSVRVIYITCRAGSPVGVRR